MPRFAANLSLLYTELPFLDRFEAAARDGFTAVEFQFPYAFTPQDVAARLRGNGLQLVLFNAPPGGADGAGFDSAWTAGQRGTASVTGAEADFRAGVECALRYADVLECPRIHCMAGLLPEGASADQTSAASSVYESNLRWAAGLAAAAGRDILIEPINTRDIPRFFLNRQQDAHAIVQRVGAPNLKVLFDLYHCQITEGDVTIVGSVASGAEVIAGGSIHVYGTLRGRALAGTMGNASARIFCRKLEAELIAIDGFYKTADDMETELRGKPVQIWLEGETIKAATLG